MSSFVPLGRRPLLPSLLSACLLTACGSASQPTEEPTPLSAQNGPAVASSQPSINCDAVDYLTATHRLESLPVIRVRGAWSEPLASCFKEEWLQGDLSLQHTQFLAGSDALTAVLKRSKHTYLKVAPRTAEHWQLISQLKNLETLELFEIEDSASPGSAGPMNYEQLAESKSLRNLVVHAPVSNSDLSAFSKLTQLETLRIESLKDVAFTTVGASHLSTLTELGGLAVAGPADAAALKALAPLSNLQGLAVSFGADFSDAGVGALSAFSKLNRTALSLSGTKVTGAMLDNPVFSGLQILDLGQTAANDKSIASIAGLEKLSELDLAETAVGDRGLASFSKLTALSTLNLAETAVSDRGLANLAKLTRLTHLDLSSTKLKNPNWKPLSGLTNLTNLKLTSTSIGDSGMRTIASLPGLQYLDLDGTKIGNGGLAMVAKLPNLKRLDVSGTKIGDAGLRHVASLASLETLKLRGTKVTDKGLAYTSAMQLRFMTVNKTRVTDRGLASIPVTLKVLFVDDKQFSDTAIAELKKRVPGISVNVQPVD